MVALMPVPHDALMEIWYAAMDAEIGIAVPSSDRRRLSIELYEARQRSGEGRLMDLTIQQPGKSDELWICHKSVEIPEE